MFAVPSDQMQGTVTLRNISTSTSGLYQCTASNAIGKSTCLLNVQVMARKSALPPFDTQLKIATRAPARLLDCFFSAFVFMNHVSTSSPAEKTNIVCTPANVEERSTKAISIAFFSPLFPFILKLPLHYSVAVLHNASRNSFPLATCFDRFHTVEWTCDMQRC